MSQHDEQLERLIAKSLDGEISPAEQRDLNQRLNANTKTRTRFDEMQALHRLCTQAMQQDILSQGEPPEVILRRARRMAAVSPPPPGWFERFLRSQFAAGLAAGLLLATLLLAWFDRDPSRSRELAQNTAAAPNEIRSLPVAPPPTVTVGDRMNYFVITDDNGNQWLIERDREDAMIPVGERSDF